MIIHTESFKTNTMQQTTTSSVIKKANNSFNIDMGETLANNKTDNVKNEKEIAKVDAEIAEKTEELNQLLEKIKKNEYTREDRECVAREKHNIAYKGVKISEGVALTGVGGLLGGLCTGNGLLAMVSGVGMAVGALAGLGLTIYFDYKGNNITDEEVRNAYAQKANGLKFEIAGLKQELHALSKGG